MTQPHPSQPKAYLRNDGNGAAQRLQGHVAQVLAIDADCSSLRLVESIQQSQNSTFAVAAKGREEEKKGVVNEEAKDERPSSKPNFVSSKTCLCYFHNHTDPDPLGPTSAALAPKGIFSDMFSKMGRPWLYLKLTFSNSMAGCSVDRMARCGARRWLTMLKRDSAGAATATGSDTLASTSSGSFSGRAFGLVYKEGQPEGSGWKERADEKSQW